MYATASAFFGPVAAALTVWRERRVGLRTHGAGQPLPAGSRCVDGSSPAYAQKIGDRIERLIDEVFEFIGNFNRSW
jgi:hypothetical protein